jgi:peptidoglycan/xylan/chitin deacetylase (PgdA/CDA1 family)
MISEQVCKKAATRIVSNIPMSVLGMLTRTTTIMPYYHIVCDDDVAHVKHLYEYKSAKQFTDDLDFLCRHYMPMSMYELLNHVKNSSPIPKRSFVLTFDDGFREMSDIVAPILLKKGINATFFINSAFADNKELCYLNKASLIVEEFKNSWSPGLDKRLSKILEDNRIDFPDVSSGVLSINYQQRHLLDAMADVMNMDFGRYLSASEPYLTTSQIRKLIHNGFTIGAHSVDHPLYSALSLEDQIKQTIDSVRFVRERYHLRYGLFAFPHSDHNVSRDYFCRIAESGLVDLSFGTAGLIDDSTPKHFQRFSLDNPVETASEVVAFQHARKLQKLVMLRHIIVRE